MFSTVFLDIPPLSHASGTVVLPGSKSISNRVLLLAALCNGTTTVHDLLDSDDTQVMLTALAQLGCHIVKEGNSISIKGIGGQTQVTIMQIVFRQCRYCDAPVDSGIGSVGQR